MSYRKYMSARDARNAKAHMIDYNKLAARKQISVLVLGAGVNPAHWMDEMSNAGLYVERNGNIVTGR